MTTLVLTSQARSALRAAAHPLRPVVWIGDKGLTDAVLKEVDAMLTVHGLIKVRVAGHERDARDQMLDTICAQLSCAAVHHLGKTLILHRPVPEQAPARKPVLPYTPKKMAATGKTLLRKARKPRHSETPKAAKPAAARPKKTPVRSALSLRPVRRRGQ